MKPKFFNSSGLTLIELMIGVLIIALIATVAIAAIQNSRAKSRDAKRVYDIQQYVKALDLYFVENNGNYPPDAGALGAGRSDSLNLALRPYLPDLPGDPQDDGGLNPDNYYYYIPANDCFGVGELVATIHALNIESNRQEYLQNPCTSGSSESGASLSDHL